MGVGVGTLNLIPFPWGKDTFPYPRLLQSGLEHFQGWNKGDASLKNHFDKRMEVVGVGADHISKDTIPR